MLLAPALSVSRGARGPGTGGGGWRRPRPWNGPGPAGLRGAQPPGRPGGRDKPPGLRLGRAGCSLRFELPSLLANSAAATSCQHVVPPTECLPPGCPTHPTQHPPAQRARRCKDLPGQGSHSPSPIVVADALGSWPAPHTPPRLPVALGPPPPTHAAQPSATHPQGTSRTPFWLRIRSSCPRQGEQVPPSGPVLPTQMGLRHEAAAAAQAHEPRGRPHVAIPAACPDGRRAAPAPRPSRGGRSRAVARPYHSRDPATDREPRGKCAPPGPAHGTLRRRRTAGQEGEARVPGAEGALGADGGGGPGHRQRPWEERPHTRRLPRRSPRPGPRGRPPAAACGVPHSPSPPAPPSSLHRSRDAVSERRPAPPMAQLCLPQGLAAGPRLPHTGASSPRTGVCLPEASCPQPLAQATIPPKETWPQPRCWLHRRPTGARVPWLGRLDPTCGYSENRGRGTGGTAQGSQVPPQPR